METDIRTRQFGVGDIVSTGWRVFSSQFFKIAPVVLCIYIPLEIIGSLFSSVPLIRSLGISLIAPIASVAIAYVVEKTIQGKDVPWGEAMRFGLSRWPSWFITSLVAGLILFGLTLLLIIPGIIWGVYYTFFVYVVALRNIDGKAALDYSKDLVQGQWWRVVGIKLVILALTVGVLIVTILPILILMFALSLLFSQSSALEPSIQALTITGSILVDVVSALFTVITVVWFLNIDYLGNPAPEVAETGRYPIPSGLPAYRPQEPAAAVQAGMAGGLETLVDRLKFGPLSLSETAHMLNVVAAVLDHEETGRHNLRPEYIYFDERQNPPLISLAQPVERISGAPEFMSPEEVRGEALDGRADVYSLAAITYYALTERPPFEGVTEQGIKYKQATEPPRRPRELRSDLPEAVDAVLLKALAKPPDDRNQTVGEFASALSAAAEGLAIHETIRPIEPEAAPIVAPAPVAAPAVPPEKKLRFSPAFAAGGVGVLALCLCVWFSVLMYTYVQTTAPFTSSQADTATSISAGSSHACALTSSGGVKCWGANDYNQLGDGTTNDRSVPVDVKGLTSGVTAIATGWYSNCALTSSGGVKCWGSNYEGRLGDDTDIDRATPVDVVGLTSGVTAIAVGDDHACALTNGGGVKCWGGRPPSGVELSEGTASDSFAPRDVNGLSGGVTAIAAGIYHSCALTNAGGVKCWLNNDVGRLRNGTLVDRTAPQVVQGLTSGVTAITVSFETDCALMNTGGVKCWGNNDVGQVGDGTTTERSAPVDVVGLTSGVAAIVPGGDHTCALMSSGGVKCWGRNNVGQLGDGTTDYHSTPVDVKGLPTGVRAIALGSDHTCVLTSSGGVHCWGANFHGQLGDGSSRGRYTPLGVKGFAQ